MDTARELIATHVAQDVLRHGTAARQLIKTDTAWIILTGEFAWKIKKPVNFVSWTTPDWKNDIFTVLRSRAEQLIQWKATFSQIDLLQ